MRGTTHFVIGVGMTGLLTETVDPIVLFSGGIAALLPDIDKSNSMIGQVLPWVSQWFEKRFPHRSCTHSLVASGVVALPTLLCAALGLLPWEESHALNIGYCVGYLADAFTKSGIEMFWPLKVKCVCPGNREFRLSTGRPLESRILVILVALTMFSMNINMHGGIKTQFNRIIATPAGVIELLDQKGSENLLVAHIKGVLSSDVSQIQDDFWVIEQRGEDLIVQSKKGEVYKAGVEPDSELEIDSIIADVDSPASIRIKSINLDDDEISTSLERFNRPVTKVFVSGKLKIDNPIDLQIAPDSRQFTTMRMSDDTVTLDDAPLAAVNRKLGDQIATGKLVIRSIFLVEHSTYE